MPADEILLDSEERMDKAVDHLKHSLTGIRTGRANPGLVDSLRVEAYGTMTPLKGLAQVGAPEPTQIVIRPFDPGTIKDIEKSDPQQRPGHESPERCRVIRLNIPPLSTDVRKKMVARIKELAEEARVSIRNVRRDANKAADQEQKDKILTEDDCDKLKEEIQELTKKYEETVNGMAASKEAEVLDN